MWSARNPEVRQNSQLLQNKKTNIEVRKAAYIQGGKLGNVDCKYGNGKEPCCVRFFARHRFFAKAFHETKRGFQQCAPEREFAGRYQLAEGNQG